MNENKTIVIDPIGGQQERAWWTLVSPTIKRTHYKFPPCVMVIKTDEERKDADGKEIFRMV